MSTAPATPSRSSARRSPGERDAVVLATKLNHQFGEGFNRSGNSRRWIFQQVDESLRRLQTDWIDLYQLHRPDPSTATSSESLGALTDLVRAGKVRYIGTLDVPRPRDRRGPLGRGAPRRSSGLACEQAPYSLLVRGIEADVLPVTQRYGMGVISVEPALRRLAHRASTARAASCRPRTAPRWCPRASTCRCPANQAKLEAVEQLSQLAESAGLTLPQLALGFIREHPGVTAAIIGPRTLDQLEAYLASAGAQLDAATLDRIDEIVPPGTVFTNADVGWEPPSLRDAAARRGGAPAPPRAVLG